MYTLVSPLRGERGGGRGGEWEDTWKIFLSSECVLCWLDCWYSRTESLSEMWERERDGTILLTGLLFPSSSSCLHSDLTRQVLLTLARPRLRADKWFPQQLLRDWETVYLVLVLLVVVGVGLHAVAVVVPHHCWLHTVGLLTRLDLSWLSSLKCWWQLLALLMLTPTLPQLLRQTNQSQGSAPTCRHLRANQSRAVWEQYRANGPHYSAEWNYVHFAGQAS